MNFKKLFVYLETHAAELERKYPALTKNVVAPTSAGVVANLAVGASTMAYHYVFTGSTSDLQAAKDHAKKNFHGHHTE